MELLSMNIEVTSCIGLPNKYVSESGFEYYVVPTCSVCNVLTKPRCPLHTVGSLLKIECK